MAETPSRTEAIQRASSSGKAIRRAELEMEEERALVVVVVDLSWRRKRAAPWYQWKERAD
jgi:hypothetical protein